MVVDTLAVVGVGLIGGSIGSAARRRGAARRVIGIGRRIESLEKARSAGAIDRATLSIRDGVSEADLVVVCSPVDRIVDHVIEAARHAPPGCLVTDAGSTKAGIVRRVEQQAVPELSFVGSHPLAGSEKSGAEHARPDLFVDRVCIITPTPQTPAGTAERATEFWQALGARVRTMTPDDHDRALATTSHLPHIVAALLAGQLPDAWSGLTGGGFRDTTRIAAGDVELWSAIVRENASALSDALGRFAERLDQLRSAVNDGDTALVRQFLHEGKKVRDALGS